MLPLPDYFMIIKENANKINTMAQCSSLGKQVEVVEKYFG